MVIRDPVHGDIDIPGALVPVMDSPTFQRLRRIRQLGTSHLVYPGALHTRFDHSLGTVHMAQGILAGLERNGEPVDASLRLVILAAALLHDVGHVAFGHTFEDERALFPRHDTPARVAMALERPDVKAALGTLAADVAALLGATALPAGVPPWARRIVAGPVDADLLDYLRRDAYFTGLRLTYDERVLKSLVIHAGVLAADATRHGQLRPDIHTELVQLLRMRYVLTERVYLHHAKVIAGAMIARAVEEAAEGGLTLADMFPLGDEALLELLARRAGGARDLICDVVDRRLLKRAWEVSPLHVPADRRGKIEALMAEVRPRRDLERELARTAGARAVIVHFPPPPVFREADLPILTPRGLVRLPEMSEEAAGLSARYRELWRASVFAPAEQASRVRSLVEEVTGVASRHAPTAP